MLDPPDRESTESCIELSLSRSQVIIPQFNPSLLLTFRTNSTKLKRSLIDTRVTREAFVKLQTSNVCYNTLGSPNRSLVQCHGDVEHHPAALRSWHDRIQQCPEVGTSLTTNKSTVTHSLPWSLVRVLISLPVTTIPITRRINLPFASRASMFSAFRKYFDCSALSRKRSWAIRGIAERPWKSCEHESHASISNFFWLVQLSTFNLQDKSQTLPRWDDHHHSNQQFETNVAAAFVSPCMHTYPPTEKPMERIAWLPLHTHN